MRLGGGGKSNRRVTSKDSLFHHHPKFYDFLPRAVAPFTGRVASMQQKMYKIREIVYQNLYLLLPVDPQN